MGNYKSQKKGLGQKMLSYFIILWTLCLNYDKVVLLLTGCCLLSQTPFISETSVNNMWHPTGWPLWWKVRFIMLTSSVGWYCVKLPSFRTYCSLHHRKQSFIQYEPLFLFVVFQRPKPQWDLWFCEHSCTFQEKGLICSHANLLYTYFRFQYHTHSKWDSIPFELHSRIWAPYLSGPEEASFFVIDKLGKIKNYWS